jgi:hypothetical protein
LKGRIIYIKLKKNSKNFQNKKNSWSFHIYFMKEVLMAYGKKKKAKGTTPLCWMIIFVS